MFDALNHCATATTDDPSTAESSSSDIYQQTPELRSDVLEVRNNYSPVVNIDDNYYW